jgi:nicotinate-nucleotide adenylyltransferase
MKVGLFFGSFNPVHVGHMVIANYILEETELDKIWFVVSPQNPLKKKDSLLDEKQRLHLVTLAIGDTNKYKASNIEFKLPQPSYTINTLTHLKEKYPQHDFTLIMGEDNLESFPKWKNYEEILKHYNIIVYPRAKAGNADLAKHLKVTKVNAPIMEISSTDIRRMIKEKKDVRYYMPEAAWQYLKEMHFYEK